MEAERKGRDIFHNVQLYIGCSSQNVIRVIKSLWMRKWWNISNIAEEVLTDRTLMEGSEVGQTPVRYR